MSQAGIYSTDNPKVRVRVVRDDDFIDDPDYAPGVRESLIEHHVNGDVYGVILERLTTLVNVDDPLDVREEWDETDSIWSCAGYKNVAKECARAFFGVTVTENAV